MRGKPLPHGVTDGLDFRGFDDYAPGMDVRHLDWPLYARTNRLYVRRYAEESAGMLVILVDASGSMGIANQRKWRRARDIAAVMVFTALRELHQVVLGVVHDGRPLWLPPTAGLDFVTEAFDFLASIAPKGRTDLAGALAALPKRRLPGRAVILSDGLDPSGGEAAFAQCAQRGLGAELGLIRLEGELVLPSTSEAVSNPEGKGVCRVEPTAEAVAAFDARVRAHDEALWASARRYQCAVRTLSVDASLSSAVEQMMGARPRSSAGRP